MCVLRLHISTLVTVTDKATDAEPMPWLEHLSITSSSCYVFKHMEVVIARAAVR